MTAADQTSDPHAALIADIERRRVFYAGYEADSEIDLMFRAADALVQEKARADRLAAIIREALNYMEDSDPDDWRSAIRDVLAQADKQIDRTTGETPT